MTRTKARPGAERNAVIVSLLAACLGAIVSAFAVQMWVGETLNVGSPSHGNCGRHSDVRFDCPGDVGKFFYMLPP